MEIFARLVPFVWPHRRNVCFSVLFAVIVAALWALNLSATFLVVKVLLQGTTLDAYVAAEIAICEEDVEGHTNRLRELEQQIEKATGGADRNVTNLHEQSRQQTKLAAVQWRLMALHWVKSYVLPWVPQDKFDTFAVILAILLFLTAVKGTCIFIQEVLVGNVVELVVLGIRKACFRRILSLDYQTLTQHGTADLMARFTNDVSVMSNGLTLLGGKIIREPLKALACILLALILNWQLTLMSALFVPLIGVVFYRLGRSLKRASHRTMESMSRIYKVLEETFDGLKIIIAFNGARHHRQHFHRGNKEYYKKAMKLVRVDSLTSPVTELMGFFAVSIALLPGAYLVLRQTDDIWGIRLASYVMDIADLSCLYALLIGVLDPLRKLSSAYAKLKRSAAGIDRVFALLDRETLVEEPEQPVALPRHSKSITFKNVYFTYAGAKQGTHHRPPALVDVSLKVRAGEVVAIVGENGSGKSTLINLLPRFCDVDHGQVLVDGIDIRDVRLSELRSQIGVVTQETILFDETISDNIRYGNPGATQAEIEAAARRAQVTQFLDQFPQGLETGVGEKGQRLSGGQRQRVALARAILRDPAILILDEATSAVDAQSESTIHDVLQEFVEGRTVFLITHSVTSRLLDFVTRIVVMENGRLIASGPHNTLMQTCNAYQRLYQAQMQQRSDGAEEGRAEDDGPDGDAEDDGPPEPQPPARHDECSQMPPAGSRDQVADDRLELVSFPVSLAPDVSPTGVPGVTPASSGQPQQAGRRKTELRRKAE